MTTTILWVALSVATFFSLWYQIRIRYWALICALSISLYAYATIMSIASILSIVFVVAAVSVISIPFLRRIVLSRPVLSVLAKQMPRISQTERDALEAGTVWWDRDLFNGRPDWNKLMSVKTTVLTDEERSFIDGPVEELCNMINDWKITHERNDLSEETWDYIRNKGFFGIIIPKKYGGLGFSAMAHSTIVMKISSRSITAAVTVMVPNSLGPAELLMRYGTDEQREYYLPRLAAGKETPCFALTETEAGSDAASMASSGVICKQTHDGKEQIGIRLNWEKRYITLGPVATLLGLAFRLYDPDHLLGEKEDLGITLALIPTTTPGVEIGDRHMPLNLAFQNGPNYGHDVFITFDNIIGGRERLGDGWRMLMDCLAAGRSISLPALSTGAGKLASRLTGAYCRIRRQFKVPLAHFEGIQVPLARIAGYTYMLDAARRLTASAVDLGEQPSVISAIIKYQHTEHMRHIVNDAMDIHAGSAICLGPQNLLGRVYQAIPIGITVEGANILTRTLIVYGQGALRCHPHLFPLFTAASNNNLRDFDKAFFGLLGGLIGKFLRAPIQALGLVNLLPVTGKKGLDKHLRKLSRLSSSFALISDCSILALGSSLKRKEALSGRLADALGMLYLASSTAKQFHDDDYPEDMQAMLDWVMQYCTYNIERSLLNVLRNFPNKPLAMLLHLLCFPTGRHSRIPDDRLTEKLSHYLYEPGRVRDVLTKDVFIPSDPDEQLSIVEEALIKTIETEHIDKRLHVAVKNNELPSLSHELLIIEAVKRGIISEIELKMLREADSLRSKVVAVDVFTQETTIRSNENGETNNARQTGLSH